jgi:very-short-patch-repair endonuclease
MASIPGKWHRKPSLWRKMRPAVRRLRSEPTLAEAALWEGLRKSRLGGVRFRRQHPIGPFIVDFCCPAARLVVEVDGPVHLEQREQDETRQAYLETRGYRVLRFSNDDVMTRTDAVLQQICDQLDRT